MVIIVRKAHLAFLGLYKMGGSFFKKNIYYDDCMKCFKLHNAESFFSIDLMKILKNHSSPKRFFPIN